MDEVEAALTAGDAELVRRIDRRVARAGARAGSCLTCHVGCTGCCIGPFPITGLDARRLRAGLEQLRRYRPWDADGVIARADSQWAEMRRGFPGDADTGALGEDEVGRARLAERFARLPCPALEPDSGRCQLYEARPVTCRLFGLPVRVGEIVEAPCELNFTTADRRTVEAAVVDADPEAFEARLLALLGDPPETVVAAALAVEDAGRET